MLKNDELLDFCLKYPYVVQDGNDSVSTVQYMFDNNIPLVIDLRMLSKAIELYNVNPIIFITYENIVKDFNNLNKLYFRRKKLEQIKKRII